MLFKITSCSKKSLMVKIIAISYTLAKQEDDLVADSKNTFAI